MRELTKDPFYELIEKYDRCILDYCLIEDDTPHQIDPAALFHIPKILRTDRTGKRFYDCGLPDPLKGEQIKKQNEMILRQT